MLIHRCYVQAPLNVPHTTVEALLANNRRTTSGAHVPMPMAVKRERGPIKATPMEVPSEFLLIPGSLLVWREPHYT